MKRNKTKAKKMSQIRKAALNRRKRLKEFKKNPNGAASQAWKKSVINCTIPKADITRSNFKEIEQFGHKTIINTEIRENGNGKMWPKGGEPNYAIIRKKIKDKIYENTARRQRDKEGNLLCSYEGGSYMYIGKRKPWYMLDNRKTYHYETAEKSWGNLTDFTRVVSEAGEMYNRTIPKKMNKCEYMEALAQHKLAKWIRNNPRPIKDDKTNPDLFEKQYIPEWEAKRDLALERFRNFVVSIYDKLHVVGNKVDRKEGKMVENVVAEIKDVDGKGHDVNYPNLREDDKLYKNATKAAITAMDKDPTIVDCDLKNHKGNQKRPLIHAKRSKAKNLKQYRALCKAA